MNKYLIDFDGRDRSKKDIYDHICNLLTEYENPDDYHDPVTENDLYHMLVEIVNNWDYLMSEDYM